MGPKLFLLAAHLLSVRAWLLGLAVQVFSLAAHLLSVGAWLLLQGAQLVLPEYGYFGGGMATFD